MDNEQLLKRGICPKCYRPLYESKYTDKILCNCEITTQPMDNTDKLKEIREKKENRVYTYKNELTDMVDKKIEQIQSETYNLAEQELNTEKHKVEVLRDALTAIWKIMYSKDDWEYAGQVYNHIQMFIDEEKKQTKQLGREEVIEEILSEAQYWENYYPQEFEKFIDTLTSLKEQKK